MFDSESCPISDNSQVSTWNSASLLSGWIPPCFQVHGPV
ncbi:rCG45047 [Rattus norvegicus]|uniref:RCG45047 n=1 Tax=Rattus norvegicus TaxID=10116 RepID=A6KQZ5_RAT|nr:rCG45047 [Rattus norvegicus]